MNAVDFRASKESFEERHIGPDLNDQKVMLEAIGVSSLEELVKEAIPDCIRTQAELDLAAPCSESEVLEQLRQRASKNKVVRSLIGMGYYDCFTPPVIQRNILENPGWYTQYTPYQAEIAQGRLEGLVNYQTMVSDLTGLALSNASLLDEATAAAEAMSMAFSVDKKKRQNFFVDELCHPQTIAVLKTRAEPLGISLEVGDISQANINFDELFGVIVQYPATDGLVRNLTGFLSKAAECNVVGVVATDLLSLCLLKSPGEMGADIAIGSAQRFGVPLGAGGPHAAFISAKEKFKRNMPGRIIGTSRDVQGRVAYRMALQTREQHIRRGAATSNICTAQVLLAIMAGMYAVYHGADGLRRIASRVTYMAHSFAKGVQILGGALVHTNFFDTVRLGNLATKQAVEAFLAAGYNVRVFDNGDIGISFDEVSTRREVSSLLGIYANLIGVKEVPALSDSLLEEEIFTIATTKRESKYLTHPVFSMYRDEHSMLRYIKRLERSDLSLTKSMIPLGSCTMKLNATVEMMPISWREFSNLHPYAPIEQSNGYEQLCKELCFWLGEITGLPSVSLQPNAGSQGEYAGLLVIRAYHRSRGHDNRNICLIPTSAHGTNPASAVMAGYKVVVVNCTSDGSIDLVDLEAKAKEHKDNLATLMVTYPSTHGVFEEGIKEACSIIHDNGGLVYLDGANLNAQLGLSRPGEYGADICHVNLHKTFCIPHGGGGPGMGPICATSELAPFLPRHPLAQEQSDVAIGPVSAAPYGSASILPISWSYIALMGSEGLRHSGQVAILNANYMAKRLEKAFDILYTNQRGRVAHEFIVDLRPYKKLVGVEVEDIAKRLMDYGFHAPTISWPVAGTMMIEPTESESLAELDRFCDALLGIREEIQAIEDGVFDKHDNPLKNAPHTAEVLTKEEWAHSYSRKQAVFPKPWVKVDKFWPSVSRIDNAYGDRNLVCTCPPIDSYSDS